MWTFGRRIAAGFTVSFVLLLGIGAVAYRALVTLGASDAMVDHTHVVLARIGDLVHLLVDGEDAERGFVITGDEAYLGPYAGAVAAVEPDLDELTRLTADNPRQQRRLAEARPAIADRVAHLKRTIDTRRTEGFDAAVKVIVGGVGKRSMDQVRRISAALEEEERALLAQRVVDDERAAQTARLTIIFGTLLALLVITVAGFAIARSLGSRIGRAVHHVQSSSAELQAAANQQASGMRESATAMNEITTTMSELLATSRQIAESARRVARVADETAAAARAVDQVVARTSDAMGGIRRQVDVIVDHMLDLGKRSQQIGGILELINELAEQTNILSINASIEAAGAGEAGRRFAVVAEEIRKLADRVGGSTKEIRGLVDEIRAAVSATVMATEGGTKAVDAGARHFTDVTHALEGIVGQVVTATDAAKEIELSTKQQATAVEQVNLAIANVAKATRETEVSSSQTLVTATELTGLSRELTRLIRRGASA
jgi:methyl-accepting chemotaxis protein